MALASHKWYSLSSLRNFAKKAIEFSSVLYFYTMNEIRCVGAIHWTAKSNCFEKSNIIFKSLEYVMYIMNRLINLASFMCLDLDEKLWP